MKGYADERELLRQYWEVRNVCVGQEGETREVIWNLMEKKYFEEKEIQAVWRLYVWIWDHDYSMFQYTYLQVSVYSLDFAFITEFSNIHTNQGSIDLFTSKITIFSKI